MVWTEYGQESGQPEARMHAYSPIKPMAYSLQPPLKACTPACPLSEHGTPA